MSDKKKPVQPQPQAPKEIQGVEVVNALVPKLLEAQISVFQQFGIPYNAVAAYLAENAHTACAVRAALIAGITREKYLESAALAYDLTFKTAEEKGLTKGMELARKSVELAQRMSHEQKSKSAT